MEWNVLHELDVHLKYKSIILNKPLLQKPFTLKGNVTAYAILYFIHIKAIIFCAIKATNIKTMDFSHNKTRQNS